MYLCTEMKNLSHRMYIHMYVPSVPLLWRILVNTPGVVLTSTSEGDIWPLTTGIILHTKSWKENLLCEFQRSWCLSSKFKNTESRKEQRSRDWGNLGWLHLWFLRGQLCYQGRASFARFTSVWPRIRFKNLPFQENDFFLYTFSPTRMLTELVFPPPSIFPFFLPWLTF